MAPVTFYRHDAARSAVPRESVAGREARHLRARARALRGDFFCLPFGGKWHAVSGRQHPPHGEIVGAPWTLLGVESAAGVTSLNLAIETKVRRGK